MVPLGAVDTGGVARRELGGEECARLLRRRARSAHLSPKINASVSHVRQQYVAEVSLARHNNVVKHSRRIEPISLSACAFCHGKRGDVGPSRMLLEGDDWEVVTQRAFELDPTVGRPER
jgi:hypothetical protein